MSKPIETDQVIRNAGLRRTIPRAVVARALREHPGHHSVGELQALIDQRYQDASGMARSSVYRALEALESAGLIHAYRTGQDEVQYEWTDRGHHHLICDQCGHVHEVRLDAVAAVEREAARDHGFATQVRHLALRGTCRSCGAHEQV